MAYCEVKDLQIGDLREPSAGTFQKYVDDAADEIDSKIGFVYETPIPVPANTTDGTTPATPRPIALLLKRINAFLASGRFILAQTSVNEDQQLNAFGAQMVADATLAIAQIASGEILLDGVTKGTLMLPKKAMPLISNGDTESAVDAFYDRFSKPTVFVSPYYGDY